MESIIMDNDARSQGEKRLTWKFFPDELAHFLFSRRCQLAPSQKPAARFWDALWLAPAVA
jgi:hypothetical protein